ncbi:MAG: 2-octaprenyl-6-methoxyphenyl hydroxylase [Oceanicoccus sp.]
MTESAVAPTMPACDYDIVIAGGGMVGASLALLLSNCSDRQLRILVVESFPIAAAAERNPAAAASPSYTPSFDARSTALSYGSRVILEPLGMWPMLSKHLAGIDSIHVSSRGNFGSTEMSSSDVHWPSLGYVVENSWLGNVLLAQLRQCPGVEFLAPGSVTAISPKCQSVAITVASESGSKEVTAQLTIVADGADSTLREQLGISASVSHYGQQALIANVSFRKDHRGCAFERFTEQGPMALLPLTNSDRGELRSALVWSLSDQQSEHLLQCSEAEFLSALQQQFGHRLGEFIRVGERFTFPLKLVQAEEQVRSGIVVMGNAAHSLHPVAGQGFNLALRDCVRLTQMLTTAHRQGHYLGYIGLLQGYVEQQLFDQQKTIGFSDKLPALFNSKQLPVSILRSLGLGALDVLPAVKKGFVHHAAGMQYGAALGV